MNGLIYARISDDPTGKAAGVDRQVSECRGLAEARGVNVVAEIIDNDLSATTGKRRPGFERVLDMIAAGTVDTVLVWHTDRLYRLPRDLEPIIDLADRHPVRFLTVEASEIDLNTSSGRMVARMLAAASAYEVEHKNARQRSSYRQRAEQGEWHFSHRPFGYRREGGEVVQVPEEVGVLREVFDRYYVKGEARNSIMNWLNASGILTPTGKPWGIIQLRDVLANDRYAGIASYNGEEVGRGNWEPIVDEDTWRSWRSTSAKRKRASTFTPAKHLLSGLIRCGVCGGKVYALPRANGSYAYACHEGRHVQRSLPKVDARVEGMILDRLQAPDALEVLAPKRPDVATLQAERDALRVRLDDLAFGIRDGLFTASTAREAGAPMRARIDAIDAILTRETGAHGVPIDLLAGAVVEHWHDRLSLVQKRAIIKALAEITLHRQDNPRRFDPEAVVVTWR